MIADLLRPAVAGYPTDYVVARVRGRQARRLSGASDEEIWRAFTAELAWLHRQLQPSLAQALSPLFALFELKTIVLAIRNRALDRGHAVRTVLAESLLSDRVQAPLRDSPDLAATVDRLVAALRQLAAPFGELAAAYADDQLHGFEDALMRIYLEQTAAAAMHPDVARFVASVVDARNLLLLHKRQRWNVSKEGPLITGGTIAPDRLAAAVTREDPAALDALVRQLTRRRGAARERALETTLLDGITARVRPLRRNSDPVAVILWYVWQLYVQARNASLMHHARDVAPDALTRELMQ
jgi:hypothetical protein